MGGEHATLYGVEPGTRGARVDLEPAYYGLPLTDLAALTTTPVRVAEAETDRLFIAFVNEGTTGIRIGNKSVTSTSGFLIAGGGAAAFDGSRGEYWAAAVSGTPTLSILREQKVRR